MLVEDHGQVGVNAALRVGQDLDVEGHQMIEVAREDEVLGHSIDRGRHGGRLSAVEDQGQVWMQPLVSVGDDGVGLGLRGRDRRHFNLPDDATATT